MLLVSEQLGQGTTQGGLVVGDEHADPCGGLVGGMGKTDGCHVQQTLPSAGACRNHRG